jgi:ABC-2 type transport system ATP-binding protein
MTNAHAASAPAAVELVSVSKSYDDVAAVTALSFAVTRGQIFSLLGPNGAGKTSTLRMMVGITMPDGGEVRLFGQPFDRRNLARVGYLPEERGLYRRMTALANLVFLGQLNGLGAREARARATAWAERLGVAQWMERKVEELSKGMQQKMQFIAAVLHEPDLLIMDEPFAGLDPVNSVQLKDVLLELKNSDRAILFSTHRMEQVEKLSDAICLLDRGRAVLSGSLREIKGRYGKRFVQIEYEGDGRLLAAHPTVESATDYGNYAELRLRPGADAQQLLREVAPRLRISRFEVMEPSLEHIFIDAVTKGDGNARA